MIFTVEGRKQTLQSLVTKVTQIEDLKDCVVRYPEFYKFARNRDWLCITFETWNGGELMQLLKTRQFCKLVVKTKDDRLTAVKELVKPSNKSEFYQVKKCKVQKENKRSNVLRVEKKAEFKEESKELQEFEELEQWEERSRRGYS